jgi:hypothetical protein
MKGEAEMKRFFYGWIKEVWATANKLNHTKLRYPNITWFHIKGTEEAPDQAAAWALEKGRIGICIEYAYFYRVEMQKILIHEVAHCFTYHKMCKRGRGESMHGNLWRSTAHSLAKFFRVPNTVADHAYHNLWCSPEQIAFCKARKPQKNKKMAVVKPVWEWKK